MKSQDHHQISKLFHRGVASFAEDNARKFPLAFARGFAPDKSQSEGVGNFEMSVVGLCHRHQLRDGGIDWPEGLSIKAFFHRGLGDFIV